MALQHVQVDELVFEEAAQHLAQGPAFLRVLARVLGGHVHQVPLTRGQPQDHLDGAGEAIDQAVQDVLVSLI